MTNINGHDPQNVTPFPGDRERRARQKTKAETPDVPHEPVLNLPPATKLLGLLILLAFIVQEYLLPLILSTDGADSLVYNLAFVPARYTGQDPLDIYAVVSPITHLFLHGGWMHLGMNLLSLLAFGSALEQWLGKRRMLLVYFASALGGVLLHLAVYPHMEAPMVGASGAISGLFGAILVAMNDRQSSGRGRFGQIVPFIVVWVIMCAGLSFFGLPGVNGQIAWAPHIGGFITGLALCRPISRMRLPS